MLWYRLSTDSRATRLVFLIFGVKSTFFSKSAKIKLKTNNFLIGIVRKDHTFLVVLPSQEGDSSTLHFMFFRYNVVITTQKDYNLECPKSVSFTNIEDALDHLALEKKYETCWVIGGSAIYDHFIAKMLCQRIYLTEIQNTFQCDRFFPKMDLEEYREIEDENVSTEEQVENGVKYSYHVYETNLNKTGYMVRR